MGFEVWQLWMFAAVVFFILEIFAPSFFMACIGIGCVAASLVSLFGGEIVAQLLFFSLATLASFVGVRPFMKKYFYKKSEHVRTNVDNLVGRTARVSERIEATGSGRVVVDGDDWKAISADNSHIAKGEQVEITKIDSVTLIVKKM